LAIIKKMKRSTRIFNKLIIGTFAIIIGIPLGIITGITCMIKIIVSYPFDIYRIAVTKIEQRAALEELLDNQDQDIWDKHIARTQQNQKQN
tara:strand:+ start:1133 stop:1405 length:273 start_codon:yes stop_codon:yes gene_type:complete